jgi:hypothetical protein
MSLQLDFKIFELSTAFNVEASTVQVTPLPKIIVLIRYPFVTTTLWPLVRERTILTEQPPLVDEINASFCG